MTNRDYDWEWIDPESRDHKTDRDLRDERKERDLLQGTGSQLRKLVSPESAAVGQEHRNSLEVSLWQG